MSNGLRNFIIIALIVIIWRSPDILNSVLAFADKLVTPPPK